MVIRPVAFPVLPHDSALLRGFCGARRLRSFCFALAPYRFWLPRSGPPRKAASGMGSRANSLPGARDRWAEQEKRLYLNRIALIGFFGSDAEKKVSNATNVAIFSLATPPISVTTGVCTQSRAAIRQAVWGPRTLPRYGNA